jgi:MFS family permease
MKIPQRYAVVGMVFASSCICYMERVGFSIAYTAAEAAAAAESSQSDEKTKGMVLSAFFYGYVLSQVPGGWAAQKMGARHVLLFSFLLWSIVCSMTPCKPPVPALLLASARFLIGIAQGFVFPCIHTLLAQWVPPHQRSRAVSLATSGMYLGAAAGMLSVPPLLRIWGSGSVYRFLALLGICWALAWLCFSADPPRSELPKATASGFGIAHPILPTSASSSSSSSSSSSKISASDAASKWRRRAHSIPWRSLLSSPAVWAIVINNFTFHYALYVLMNWLPTYFDQGLGASLESLGVSKTVPYLNMFLFSNVGGILADHLIVGRAMPVTRVRKLLNTGGFVAASFALFLMAGVRSPAAAIVLSSLCLGLCALARAGFAVNHMDIAPRYAGIVMGISNTAGTLAGIVGVGLTGQILEAAKARSLHLSDPESWTMVFVTPAVLCILSCLFFLTFATGERIFD